ncbi:glycosyltransferase, partial [Thermococcus sp. GR7]
VVIVLSKYWKKLFSKELGIPEHKLVIVPNGVDIDKFKMHNHEDCRRKLELPSNKKIIFSLGNLIERKGFRYLIKALNELVKYRRDFICFIGGSGPDRNNLQKMINAIGLEKYVKLIGYVPDDLLPIWMSAAD